MTADTFSGELWRGTQHSGYEVSDHGRVARLGSWVAIGKAQRWIPYAILSGSIFSNGYLYVTLKGHKKVAVHRLVAMAFCQKPDGKTVVNHKDGNKLNNASSNLEWVTPAENKRHAHTVLKVHGSCKGKLSSDHPSSKSVVATCMRTGAQVVYKSAMDAVRAGYRSDCISRACRGLIAHHAGHYWRFLHATAADRGVTVYQEQAA